jgi:hypothetical protein
MVSPNEAASFPLACLLEFKKVTQSRGHSHSIGACGGGREL